MIKSQADQNYYQSIISINSFIGLFQNDNSSNFSEPNGGWEWVDGTPLLWNAGSNIYTGFENWHPGQPDGGGQDFATFNFGGTGLWDDDNAGRPFAMAVDKSPIENISISCKRTSIRIRHCYRIISWC